VLLEVREGGDRAGELVVRDRQLEAPGRLQSQFPLDHAVQDLPRQVEGSREVRRKAAFVEFAVLLDLILVDPVELDRRDLTSADLRDDLARGVSAPVRAG